MSTSISPPGSLTIQLSDLKAGDPVIVERGGLGRSREVCYIAKTTSKQIVLTWQRENAPVYKMRFNKTSGRHIGGSTYGAAYIVAATLELIEKVRRENRHVCFVRKLNDVKWRTLPLETLEAVYALLPEEKPKESAT